MVGGLTEDGAAAQAGFLEGDQIISADGEAIPLWMDWVTHVRASPNQAITVELERAGARQHLSVTPAAVMAEGERIGAVGMSVALPVIPDAQQRHFDRGPVEALVASVKRTGDLVVFTFKSFIRMLQGLFENMGSKILGKRMFLFFAHILYSKCFHKIVRIVHFRYLGLVYAFFLQLVVHT